MLLFPKKTGTTLKHVNFFAKEFHRIISGEKSIANKTTGTCLVVLRRFLVDERKLVEEVREGEVDHIQPVLQNLQGGDRDVSLLVVRRARFISTVSHQTHTPHPVPFN